MQANDAAIKKHQNSQLDQRGAALPNMLESKFLRPDFAHFTKGNTMTDDPLDFLAESLQAQEIMLHALVKSLQKFNPEVTAEFITHLDHVIKHAPQLPQGVQQNIAALASGVRATQPKQPAVH